MVQQSNYLTPQTEQQLRDLIDSFYAKSKEHFNTGKKISFGGLLEIICSPVVIQTAIHKVKANQGSKTPGSDKKTIRDILEKPFPEVINTFQKHFQSYRSKPVRRVHIDKPGKTEKRPLGIPTIEDRIVQECVRIVIEPILEAQFYQHSYGFRPQRDAEHAISRIAHIAHSTNNNWVIEGDISKFFDNVNHTVLIRKLWDMGIHDKRVLMIIKQMLKAGVMKEKLVNDLGTPQGGIISPLLANVYLNSFDWFVANAWDNKKTTHHYKSRDAKFNMLKKHTKLIPIFLIRYADDWVAFTNSRENAIKWKNIIENYLRDNLKLKLSREKTKITNVKKQPIHFLGFTYRRVKGNSKDGWISSIKPDEQRLKTKVKDILKSVKKINGHPTTEGRIYQLNLVNSKIRGVINYYSIATKVSNIMRKYSWIIKTSAIHRIINRRGGKLVKANESDNLRHIHQHYTTKEPAFVYEGRIIALTDLAFCEWRMGKMKNQDETPYSANGRKLHRERTLKKPLNARCDTIMSENLAKIIAFNKGFVWSPKYNFEYFLNRAYAFNRDKGKCKICSEYLDGYNLHTHHIHPKLPMELINKVNNLASLCKECHIKLHDGNTHLSELNSKQWKKVLVYREKLAV